MNLRLWLSGLRPKTLPASIAPVLVGAALASRIINQLGTCIEIYPEPADCAANRTIAEPLQAHFWPVAILCMLVALFLQIAVNFANDYSDGVRGTDDGRNMAESKGWSQANGRGAKPQRLVASGVPPKHVLAAAGIAAVLTAVCGLVAVIISQAWWLLAVGALSLIAGWFYTGGRHPYGYAGLGEAAVFLFFGLAAVLGTEYALSSTIDTLGVAAAICCGLNAAMLLMVNNLRDIESDRAHSKRTLAVRLGEKRATIMLMICCILAWALGLFLCMYLWMPWGGILLISGIAVPIRMVSSVPKHQFRTALSDAGFQTLLFAVVVVLSAML
ncbi:1,4-dihydroxy-2-naphthoate octaprenyltransferase [Bifidobacterium felsineum]|uniref:1,4-dihydroxy-2-naphthoate octaprenyltransferase n=1 Tax=Bifidobacterium felsineum TaxID=2045440 RepID=A0A2M9HMA5_9BIFI|nr:1,4-dihydroxy-2-naphthoate octaprenyltransferase [Bifidobacterium felsineum]MBT1163391.1 1,4-dihydroxy-2-naphthoate octaprenyltransferase [Bifidobacterium felsineum]PJM77932.1 1,4-dihydroxy-2-naphthoate octaprenyltransferase [Bifidobacterium felsineum]